MSQDISWFSPSLSFKYAPGSQGIVIAAISGITSVDRAMAWNIKILESLSKTHCVAGAFQLWQQPLLSWPMISSCVLTSHLISHLVLVCTDSLGPKQLQGGLTSCPFHSGLVFWLLPTFEVYTPYPFVCTCTNSCNAEWPRSSVLAYLTMRWIIRVALILDHDGKHVYTFVRPKRRSKENAMAKEADFALGNDEENNAPAGSNMSGRLALDRTQELDCPMLLTKRDHRNGVKVFEQIRYRTPWSTPSQLFLSVSCSSSDIDMSPGTGFVTMLCNLLEAEAWHQEQREKKRGPMDQLGCSCNWWYSRGAW